MSWLSELAEKAENLLNNIDEQTGAALRNHKKKNDSINSLRETSNAKWKLPIKKQNSPSSSKDTSPVRRNRIPVKENSSKNIAMVSPTTGSPRAMKSQKGSPPTGSAQKWSPATGSSQKGTSLPGTPDTRSPAPGQSPTGSPQTLRKYLNKKKVNFQTTNDTSKPPMTVVSNISTFELEPKNTMRRSSLPTKFDTDEEWLYKMQNLEIENIMLKNELNVTNKDFLEVLLKLRKSEENVDDDTADGQDSGHKIQMKSIDVQVRPTENELLKMKESQTSDCDNVPNIVNDEVTTLKKENTQLRDELDTLRNTVQELEQKCKKQEEESSDSVNLCKKLESDLKHAQSTINALQGSFDLATKECRRLEKDWEAYKLRVKNMLNAKDNQIKTLQEGKDDNNETEELKKTIEYLKEERDELMKTTETIKSQYLEMQTNIQKMETQQIAAERVLTALRDALREEHTLRTNTEAQCVMAFKQMKNIQMESNVALEKLRAELSEKNEEINRLRQVNTFKTDSSALNVADYDVLQEAADNNKIQYLTQMLVQKQSKMDKLIAYNNTLKIQMQKLEQKCKTESNQMNNVNVMVHEVDSRHRLRLNPPGVAAALSVRLGVILKRYPVIRLFILFYMICLHFWVLTVLFTSTPDYASKPRL